MTIFTRCSVVVLLAVIMAGCVPDTEGLYRPTPNGRYVSSNSAGWMSTGLDANDYRMAAENLVTQLLNKRGQIPDNYVLALGPVDTKGSTSSIDYQRLQDKLELALSDTARLKFSALQSTTMPGMDAYAILNKLAELNYENLSSDDREWLQMFGKRAAINGILYGRVSSEKRYPQSKSGAQIAEVTYTFVWRVADVNDGLVKAIVEYEFRKVVAP